MGDDINRRRRDLLRAAAAGFAASHLDRLPGFPEEAGGSGGELAALDRATAWLNSPALTAAELKNKVVLVDFWTYTCINWLRTLPYRRAWSEKYRDHGLVLIGIHSPEFEFEKRLENVRRAVRDFGISYPVAVDSDHLIWQGFDNHYWPALYLLDGRGGIRHRKFGEGGYDESERMIQRLLAEAGQDGFDRELVSVVAQGLEAPADWDNVRSPESYLGYDRSETFASPGGAARDTPRAYTAPPRLALNQWALEGDWTIRGQGAALNRPAGRIVSRFHARDLNLAMGPTRRGGSARFRVLLDGQAPGKAHGLDVDAQGNGTVAEQRLYQLVRQPGAHRRSAVRDLVPRRGAEAFVFTFG